MILPPDPPCTPPPPGFPTAIVGLYYDYTPASDGDCGVDIAFDLPYGPLVPFNPGLFIDNSTGRIFGTPTTAGSFTGMADCDVGIGRPCTGKSNSQPLGPIPFTFTIVRSWFGASSGSNFAPPVGQVGQTVLLHICNITGTTGVTVNGIAATFTVIDDCTISIIIPSGAGNGGPIIVTTPGGPITSPTNFTITPIYGPQITSLVDG